MAEHLGRRAAFLVVGLPGLVIAVVFKLTVKEPPRGHTDPPGAEKVGRSTFADGMKVLLSKKSFWAMTAGTTIASFCGYGIVSFQSLFVNRNFHLSTQDASLYVNAPVAFASAMGPLFIGAVSDHLSHAKLAALGRGGQLVRRDCEGGFKALSAAKKAVCNVAHPESLQSAMPITACFYALAGLSLLLACRWLKRDMVARA